MRHLTAMEKMSGLGFPATEQVAKKLGLPILQYQDWPALHKRAGNTQHLPQAAPCLGSFQLLASLTWKF